MTVTRSFFGAALGVCALMTNSAAAAPAKTALDDEANEPRPVERPTPESSDSARFDTGAPEPTAAAGPAEHPCAEYCDEPFHRSTIGFGVALGVAHLPEMDGLNEALHEAMLDGLPSFAPYLSFSIPMTIDRFVLLTQVRWMSLGDARDSSQLEAVVGSLSFGYSLTPPEYLALYPYFGLGIAATELSVGQAGPMTDSFQQALREGVGQATMTSRTFLGTMGMAAELLIARVQRHPTRGMFLGLHVGHTAAFVSSDWSMGTELPSLDGGPQPPVSGFHGHFAFGLRL